MPRSAVPTEPADIAARIEEVAVADELRDSFMPYALSVITARTIPDVRDGLKPVQRRILFAMDALGLNPGSPFRKSAAVVGEVMGKYHPHGDSAIYDAMVRMGQPFNISVPLIDPKGNFGSLDDPPAAYRYTEARLTAAAAALTADINEETVDFAPTFDGERTEPTCLPAALPNLLVNGASGIAVGMATNMAPHNLAEVAAAIDLVLKTYKSSTKSRRQSTAGPTTTELLAHMPAPDFPTGGLVIDDGTLAATYEAGRGSVRVRARAHVENATARRQRIVITELPHPVGPEQAVREIRALQEKGQLADVTGVTDLSDRHSGLRLVVDLRPDRPALAVLGTLYKGTSLEGTFAINNVVLVDGVPQTLSLVELCRHFIAHRLEVITRRTQFRLERARNRLHIVEGLLIALDNIDQVIAIIRGSPDAATARTRLIDQLGLTETQANHILDLQLRRLTALEVDKLRAEQAALNKSIDEYQKLLASEARRKTLLRKELADLASRFGGPRRSTVVTQAEANEHTAAHAATAGGQVALASDGGTNGLHLSTDGADDGPLAGAPTDPQAHGTLRVTCSVSGTLGRRPTGQPLTTNTPRRDDVLAFETEARPTGTLIAVTSMGRAHLLPAEQIAPIAGRSRGVRVGESLPLGPREAVVGLLGDDPPPGGHVFIATATGTAKRLERAAVEKAAATGQPLLTPVTKADRLVAAFDVARNAEIAFVTTAGRVLRTEAEGFPIRTPKAGPINAVKQQDSQGLRQQVLTAGTVGFDTTAALVTVAGAVKLTSLSDVATGSRDTLGLMALKLSPERDETAVVAAHLGRPDALAALVAKRTDPDPTTGRFSNVPHNEPLPLELQPTGRNRPARTLHWPTGHPNHEPTTSATETADAATDPNTLRAVAVGTYRFA